MSKVNLGPKPRALVNTCKRGDGPKVRGQLMLARKMAWWLICKKNRKTVKMVRQAQTKQARSRCKIAKYQTIGECYLPVLDVRLNSNPLDAMS